MSEEEHLTRDESSQTRLQVTPHVLEENERAVVTCSRATQTAISQTPGPDDEILYSLLEFVPYKEISRNAIRTIDIPRKTRLQFMMPEVHSRTSAVSSVGPSTKSVLRRPKVLVEETVHETNSAQTVLQVAPHILDNDNLAVVRRCSSMQTLLTLAPNLPNSGLTSTMVKSCIEKSCQTDGDHRAEILGREKIPLELDPYYAVNVTLFNIIQRIVSEDSNFSNSRERYRDSLNTKRIMTDYIAPESSRQMKDKGTHCECFNAEDESECGCATLRVTEVQSEGQEVNKMRHGNPKRFVSASQMDSPNTFFLNKQMISEWEATGKMNAEYLNASSDGQEEPKKHPRLLIRDSPTQLEVVQIDANSSGEVPCDGTNRMEGSSGNFISNLFYCTYEHPNTAVIKHRLKMKLNVDEVQPNEDENVCRSCQLQKEIEAYQEKLMKKVQRTKEPKDIPSEEAKIPDKPQLKKVLEFVDISASEGKSNSQGGEMPKVSVRKALSSESIRIKIREKRKTSLLPSDILNKEMKIPKKPTKKPQNPFEFSQETTKKLGEICTRCHLIKQWKSAKESQQKSDILGTPRQNFEGPTTDEKGRHDQGDKSLVSLVRDLERNVNKRAVKIDRKSTYLTPGERLLRDLQLPPKDKRVCKRTTIRPANLSGCKVEDADMFGDYLGRRRHMHIDCECSPGPSGAVPCISPIQSPVASRISVRRGEAFGDRKHNNKNEKPKDPEK